MKILIIDDQEHRRDSYKRLETVGAFSSEIQFLEESQITNMDKAYVNRFDLVLLDVVLDGKWKTKSSYVARVIRDFSIDIPIVLVTGNWSATSNSEISELARNYDTEPVPLSFTDFLNSNDVGNQNVEKYDLADGSRVSDDNVYYIARMLDSILQKRKGICFLGGENDPINILHISDLQCGGAQVTGSLLDPYSIAQHVLHNHNKPDFLVVTGDIAEKGEKEEYLEAEKWLDTLCKQFGWDKPYDRLLLVPGNHDIFAPTYGICSTIYDRDKGRFITLSDHQKVEGISEIALNNFKSFYQRMTGKIDESCSKGYWIFDKYSSSGVVFMGINSIINSDYKSPFYGLPDSKILKNLKDDLVNSRIAQDSLVVALVHHPTILAHEEFRVFSEAFPYAQLLLAGHVHKSDFNRDIQLDVLISVAPTSSLEKENRIEGASRGFSVVELKKESNMIQRASFYSHIKANDRWESVGKSIKYLFCPTKQDAIWREFHDD